MKKLDYIQLYKENEKFCLEAQRLWIDFIKEVNTNDGKKQTEEQILDGFNKRVSIQGKRKDMHFEVAFLNGTPIGIAMFAIDLGTVYGLLEKGYGTVMGFILIRIIEERDMAKKFGNISRMFFVLMVLQDFMCVRIL